MTATSTMEEIVLQWLHWLEQFNEKYDDWWELIGPMLAYSGIIIAIGIIIGYFVALLGENSAVNIAWGAASVWFVAFVFLVVIFRWASRGLVWYFEKLRWL